MKTKKTAITISLPQDDVETLETIAKQFFHSRSSMASAIVSSATQKWRSLPDDEKQSFTI